MIKIIELEEELKVGLNGFWELRYELEKFVDENFDLLYEGAVRLKCNVTKDYWAPKRVQIRETRLHKTTGLKYADGHKYSSDHPPTETQLRQTVKDLNKLIEAAVEDIPKPFTIVLPET